MRIAKEWWIFIGCSIGFLVSMIFVGNYIAAWKSAVIVGVFLPILVVCFYFAPNAENGWSQMGIRAGRRVVPAILAIALIFLAIGIISPEVKKSLDQYAEGTEESLVNKIDNASFKTVQESQDRWFYIVTEDTKAWAPVSQKYIEVKKGAKVMYCKERRKIDSKQGEGVSLVMLPNSNGDYIHGERVVIPIRKMLRDGDKSKKELVAEKAEKPEKNEFRLEKQASAQPRSSVGKVEGKDCWVVMYYPEENPGWIGPTLQKGRYEIIARQTPVQVIINGYEKRIEGVEIVELIPNSTVKVFSKEVANVTIRRVG